VASNVGSNWISLFAYGGMAEMIYFFAEIANTIKDHAT
jgi:hypothetical protein